MLSQWSVRKAIKMACHSTQRYIREKRDDEIIFNHVLYLGTVQFVLCTGDSNMIDLIFYGHIRFPRAYIRVYSTVKGKIALLIQIQAGTGHVFCRYSGPIVR